MRKIVSPEDVPENVEICFVSNNTIKIIVNIKNPIFKQP